MKSAGHYIFWFVMIICVIGLFIGLALFFQTAVPIERPQAQSVINAKRKFPEVSVPTEKKNTENVQAAKLPSQSTPTVKPQVVTKPKSTSITKTS